MQQSFGPPSAFEGADTAAVRRDPPLFFSTNSQHLKLEALKAPGSQTEVFLSCLSALPRSRSGISAIRAMPSTPHQWGVGVSFQACTETRAPTGGGVSAAALRTMMRMLPSPLKLLTV